MFIGVDHGTTAIRFANRDAYFEITRGEAAEIEEETLFGRIKSELGVDRDEIKMLAMTYSMGDGIESILPIDKVRNRGLIEQTGAGEHIGGGTRIFDLMRASGVPAVVIPGVHRGSGCDLRLDVFSHGASPEKIGIAYHIYKRGVQSFIVSDISSNTVTVAVAYGRVVGAIDACIFAPGIHHGPLDVEAIRTVDAGRCTANEAFAHAGVIKDTPYETMVELINAYREGKGDAVRALDTVALLSAMEIASMVVLMEDYGVEPANRQIYLSGTISEVEYVATQIGKHLRTQVVSIGRMSAALGLSEMAKDIYNGKKDVIGIKVEI
ncbi:methanogenesis marker 12 protein [Methanosarcinales archaeon ex4572_44]|nr:MAG: methanogenesis marker 12 protein [Methanosarcinales archaeon ex4484_138]PHP45993.1 MAG: methanogenesis marker 12 protein [Methanosarcinales archaeon ex4572_44]RLG26982.1 MAG: methanogenesis marker 12 protein [Methanosarcinales archaeon]RLG28572.1 MAG: methanogenesis marker 12 protein [Methanosarcinales archaeon]